MKHRGRGGVPPLFHAVDETRQIPNTILGRTRLGAGGAAAGSRA